MLHRSTKHQQGNEFLGSDLHDRRQPCNDRLEHNPLVDPIDVGRLQFAVKRVLDKCHTATELDTRREKPQGRCTLPNVVSINPHMMAIFDLIGQVAQTATTGLIEGETGTGKEQAARAIHQLSRSRFGPMVAVTCEHCRSSCWKVSCSATRKGPSPVLSASARAGLNWPEGAPYSSMRSATCPRQCRPSSCGFARTTLRARRRHGEYFSGRAGGRRHQSVPAAVGPRRHVSRGPFLSAERGQARPAASAQRPEDIPLLAVHFTRKYAPSAGSQRD